MTAKNEQQANEAKATSTKSRDNAHSAQTKLNASLDPNSYQSRLQQLQTQALAKCDKILNKASEPKSNKKTKKSTTKSSKKTSKSASKPSPAAKTIEESEESDTQLDAIVIVTTRLPRIPNPSLLIIILRSKQNLLKCLFLNVSNISQCSANFELIAD